MGSAPGSVSLWRLTDGERLWRGGWVAFAFSPDGKLFARSETDAQNFEQLIVSPVDGQGHVHTLGSSYDRIDEMFFSPDSQLLAIHVLWDRVTQVWRLTDDRLIFTYQPECR